MVAASSTASADYSDLEVNLTRHTRYRYVADLEEVKRRGVLRVLTRNNSEDYFIARGLERGFQFELASAFARALGVRVAFVVPPSREALIQALLRGEGDLIAAGMTVTPVRAEKVRFTRAVLEAPRVVVTKEGIEQPPVDVEHLDRFPIHLSFRSTTYRDALDLIERTGVKLELVDVTDGVEMDEMMRRVAAGRYPATIADASLVSHARSFGLQVEGRIPIGAPREKAWAVHPAAPHLREAADAFIADAKQNGLHRVLYARYYKTRSKWARRAQEEEYRADQAGKISPYDRLFKRAGEETGLDWRLIAAVAYTESRFDPEAKSNWGAVGLMQVLPSTARGLGVDGDLTDPEVNVRVGARYMKRLVARFEEDEVEKRQRVRFAVAAYNAGLGHILDARRLATQTGRDRNRWFHNVEDALLLKRERKWHEKTKYGYCRAGETIGYVSAVQARYDVYVRHVPL